MNQHRSPNIIKHEIEQTRRDMREITLRDRTVIKGHIALLNAKATIDPGYKGELVVALNELAAADANHLAHAQLNDKLNKLLDEFNEAERLEGVMARESASRRMQEAEHEFQAHCKAAAMAYAKLIVTSRQCGSTKPLPVFDASNIRPFSWQGPVSSIMQQSPNPFLALPWMNTDHKEAA